MDKFAVDFLPPLFSHASTKVVPSFGGIVDSNISEKFPGEYLLSYIINDEKFCYYPSSIMTVLNDLYLELDSLRNCETHDVTLSGYTVLIADIKKDEVIFRDPTSLRHTRIVGIISLLSVQASVETAISSIIYV